jgi:hypothetical protein
VSTLGDRRSRVDRRRTLSLYTLSACLANLVPEYVQLFLPSVRPSNVSPPAVACTLRLGAFVGVVLCVHGRGLGTGVIVEFEGAGQSTVCAGDTSVSMKPCHPASRALSRILILVPWSLLPKQPPKAAQNEANDVAAE